MTPTEQVRKWIADHFEEDSVELVPMPALPGGCRVIDSHGKELLVWFDVVGQQVKYDYPKEVNYGI